MEHIHRNQKNICQKQIHCVLLFHCKLNLAVFDEKALFAERIFLKGTWLSETAWFKKSAILIYRFVTTVRLFSTGYESLLLVASFSKIKIDKISETVYIQKFNLFVSCSFSNMVTSVLQNNASLYLSGENFLR